jgi:hypothetical protein
MGAEDALRKWLDHAARLKASDASLDCRAALRKAAETLGLDARHPPDCVELEEALRAYQQLFRPEQAPALRRLRIRALEAMRFFAAFEPRLVGAVLSGTADAHSIITLHLFADTPEEVMLRLVEHDIPFDEGVRMLRYRGGRSRDYPVFSLVVDGSPVDLVVLSPVDLREAPLGVSGSGAMQRAGIRRLEEILSGE